MPIPDPTPHYYYPLGSDTRFSLRNWWCGPLRQPHFSVSLHTTQQLACPGVISPSIAVQVRLRKSKCDQFGKGAHIFLAPQGLRSALYSLFYSTREWGSFFLLSSGAPVTKMWFTNHIRDIPASHRIITPSASARQLWLESFPPVCQLARSTSPPLVALNPDLELTIIAYLCILLSCFCLCLVYIFGNCHLPVNMYTLGLNEGPPPPKHMLTTGAPLSVLPQKRHVTPNPQRVQLRPKMWLISTPRIRHTNSV